MYAEMVLEQDEGSYELHMMEQLQEQYTGCGINIINKIITNLR
jgi:hypothetical protein